MPSAVLRLGASGAALHVCLTASLALGPDPLPVHHPKQTHPIPSHPIHDHRITIASSHRVLGPMLRSLSENLRAPPIRKWP
eukprot:CAMPEP_0194780422 /NCGR_PEP_ID=MMETSP0323_2-20130528/73683_1 /TAXON_ID=2866 ORGANISM="Crypthecodinium cohnii, Strain Seligo" /NCGR_SAMPLE_ID=MMETSP0323_2 /ASSEMBLY_ACC=CAM_ASM_000346 /LENGTH=80 /DNA_ID=CAMNT_0039718401 /DNA_START=107 /DNA_END=345 /DNA_ORIENTATION=+